MIRMIEEKDIPVCLAWYNWYIERSPATFEIKQLSLEQFAGRVHRIRETYPYIVLEEGGRIMGYAYLDHFNARSAYDWMADVSIYVDPASRGKGCGKQLMQALIAAAEKDGYRKLVSVITEGNTASERLHASFGFQRKMLLENAGYKNGEWHGVSYYVKDLEGFDPSHPGKPENLDVDAW